ncbi:MAG: aminotransferase class I/II-fold pyridoxal phosphate-dependent enzyme [Ruminococcaceae bacterium]|nr:aminotransferase class I/II-fold pyridoxal phosphate-dependent enzyme [Oscillospiraceae bacterium]
MSGLYEKLKNYGKQYICPMHMPGHKRKIGICSDIDITEIEGFDNLANPSTVLKELQDGWARIYGADNAFISVNGSTGAILAAICGMCKKGDKIIMARNCHKAVYNAAMLMELECEYIFPEYDDLGIARGINAESVLKAVEDNKDAKLIVLTSPTYEGRTSRIDEICRIAHENNMSVFVDSAHGAHMEFMGKENPIRQGADAVCVSLHKTLPSMTQTALLMIKGDRAMASYIKEKLNVFQTSSPSYVLMASVSECLDFVVNGKDRFKCYADNLEKFYEKAEFKSLELIKNDDLGKIVISTAKTDISGKALMKILRESYGIELEMAYDNYALAMTSVCDGERELNRLLCALTEIDKSVKVGQKKKVKYPTPRKSEKARGETETVMFNEAVFRVSASYVWAYPPGIPIIAPGEVIDNEIIEYISGLNETDVFGICNGEIAVYCE